jgi:hypothetical protein
MVKSKLAWQIVNEFTDENADVNVRVTLSDNGIYSYHIGRCVKNGEQSRHLGIFTNKKTRQITNSRILAITDLVKCAETWIQAELNKQVVTQ